MMKNSFILKNNITKKILKSTTLKKYSKQYKKVFEDLQNEINSENQTLNVLNSNFSLNFNKKELKRFSLFNEIAVIGMGGSILGAEALNSFLKKKIKKKFYFFNNLDIKKISDFKKKKNLKKTLFIIISKSGTTIETISNLLFLNIIKKNSKNIILISERKNNPLYSISKKYNLLFIEHKNYVGGRYSVLSEVGIVPAFLMGLNIFKLRGRLEHFFNSKNKKILKESSIKLASAMKTNKFTNLIFLNYIPELERFLFWCQQLIAESLGKKKKGFLPVISNAPQDHHSLLQLYLDGPKNNIFNIFSYDSEIQNNIKVNKINKDLKYLHNKSLEQIKFCQKEALVKVLKKNKIPYREFKIKKIDEKVIFQLFTYFILETVAIGKLTNINPFNQPAVEQVKLLTKKSLNKKVRK